MSETPKEKLEYRVLNHSEIAKRVQDDTAKNLVEVLNQLGAEGWEICFNLNQSSYLLKRRITGSGK